MQKVICHFEEAQKVEYAEQLLCLATPLLSFIYTIDAIRRGFLEDGDVPHWVNEPLKKVIFSCFKMWGACYQRVKGDGDQLRAMGPFQEPLQLFKHSTQSEYNSAKWGLDKCTEHSKKVQFYTKRMGFEAKYVKRMFDGAAVVNSW